MKNNDSDKDIQAAKAWQQMKALLDVEMPEKKDGGDNRRRYTLLLFLLLIGGCGVYKLFVSQTGKSWEGDAATAVNKQEIESVVQSKRKPLEDNQQLGSKPGNVNEQSESRKESKVVENKSTIKSSISGDVRDKEFDLKVGQSSAKRDEGKMPKRSEDGPIAHHSLRILQRTKQAGNKNQKEITVQANIATPDLIAGSSITKPGTNDTKHKPNGSKINALQESKAIEDAVLPDLKSGSEAQAGVIKDYKKSLADDSTSNKSTAKINDRKATQPGSKMPIDAAGKKMHVGLEWNVALPFSNNALFKEVNAKNRPLTILIPSLWVSRQLSTKSGLLLTFNPYSQYLLNKRSTLQSGNYTLSATSATNINQPVNTVSLTQSYSLAKVMGMEMGLQYVYSLNDKWSASAGVGNTWTRTALFNETLVKNTTEVIKDSLYGVIKTDKDWQYISSGFLSGKIAVAYRFKQYQIGATISKPLSDVYEQSGSGHRPFNGQVFLRWRIK